MRKLEWIGQEKQTRTTVMVNKSSMASLISPLQGGSTKNEEHFGIEKFSKERKMGWIKKETTKWQ